MNRRDFLRTTGLASAAFAVPAGRAFAQATESDGWRMFEVTTRVEVLNPAGVTRVWLPVPLTEDRPFLKALGNSFDAEGGTTRYAVDPQYGAGMVCGEWNQGTQPMLA